MGAWILGITGVVCLGVLIEILLPDGQAGKYVKGAFSLLVVFAVAAPLPSVVKSLREWSVGSASISVDGDFLAVTAGEYAGERAERLEEILADDGYQTDVKLVVSSDKMSNIVKCTVVLYLSVLDGEEENKHIARVREVAAERLGIADERVAVEVNYVKEGEGGS